MPNAVALRDGSSVLLRPLEPGEQDLVASIYRDMSDRTRRLRFLAPARELTPEDLDYLTAVDHNRHEAVVGIEADSGRPLGIARYVRVPGERDSAEVAVVVIDEWQNRGLGTALIEELGNRARENGIRRWLAVVSDDNEVVLRGLDRAGAERVGNTEAGEVEFEFDLFGERLTERLRAALRAAATAPLEFVALLAKRLVAWRRWL
jgi:L-amino acid N-acyltransferase YncA